MTREDATLWRRWCEVRDGSAFAALVTTYAPFVYDLAHRITEHAAAAEDLTQEPFHTLSRAPRQRFPDGSRIPLPSL